MPSIQHYDNHHKAIFSDQTRRKLSLILLSLTGAACLTLLVMLGKSM